MEGHGSDWHSTAARPHGRKRATSGPLRRRIAAIATGSWLPLGPMQPAQPHIDCHDDSVISLHLSTRVKPLMSYFHRTVQYSMFVLDSSTLTNLEPHAKCPHAQAEPTAVSLGMARTSAIYLPTQRAAPHLRRARVAFSLPIAVSTRGAASAHAPQAHRRQRWAVRRTLAPTCGTSPPSPRVPRTPLPSPRGPPNAYPGVILALYVTRLFLLPPTPPTPLASLREALDLSLNFAFVLPLSFPDFAPSLHPVLEAVFHIVVSWAALLLGFAAVDIHAPSSEERVVTDVSTQDDESNKDEGPYPRAGPFLMMGLLLTNLFYLPFLTVRRPARSPTALSRVPAKWRGLLVTIGESRWLPLSMSVLTIGSIMWGLYARGEYGDIITRWKSFLPLIQGRDIVAHSFGLDLLVFALTQGVLVEEDAERRTWSGGEGVRRRAVWMGRFVPFVGLVGYLVERAQRAPIGWVGDTDDDEAEGTQP